MVSDLRLPLYATTKLLCLNPCSNGIWSLTHGLCAGGVSQRRPNPCSNGIWSLTGEVSSEDLELERLNPCSNGIWSLTENVDHLDQHAIKS